MALSQDSNTLLDTSSLQSLNAARVAIVYTEWNDRIVAEQRAGADRVLEAHQAQVSNYIVPGCFELPFACKQLSALKDDQRPEAIIAFGVVIRGGTPHFDYVCKAVTEGITQLNVTTDIPVIFGVLTLDNEAQAWERLGGAHGHKGEEAAIAALKMISLKRSLQQ